MLLSPITLILVSLISYALGVVTVLVGIKIGLRAVGQDRLLVKKPPKIRATAGRKQPDDNLEKVKMSPGRGKHMIRLPGGRVRAIK